MAFQDDTTAGRDRALALLEDVILAFGEPERPDFIPDLPIRMSVWHAFATAPQDRHTLLIQPNEDMAQTAAVAAVRRALDAAEIQGDTMLIALRNTLRVSVTMDEFFWVLLPCTVWFRTTVEPGLEAWIASLQAVNEAEDLAAMQRIFRAQPDKAMWRFLAAWTVIRASTGLDPAARWAALEAWCAALMRVGEIEDVTHLPQELREKITENVRTFTGQMLQTYPDKLEDTRRARAMTGGPAPIWTADLNRPVDLAIAESRRTIKVDAAERVFAGSARRIRWAVIDSGIDATHPAFARKTPDGVPAIRPADSRIVATYDFTRLLALFRQDFRALLPEAEIARLGDDPNAKAAATSLDDAILTTLYHRNSPMVEDRLSTRDLHDALTDAGFRDQVKDYVGEVKQRITRGAMIDWPLVAPLLRIPHDQLYTPPGNGHGTHVAGTIAGHLPADAMVDDDGFSISDEDVTGMCPDMWLYDLRVADADGQSDEFLVLAALQFVEYLNRAQDRMEVHGANVSLQVAHKVRNYACGQTPICREANDLVASGVVVVAAAGNKGFNRVRTETGFADSYAWSSITDPGNAEDVITVGATHRSRPHSYGVSYFSSRGPTGDGRQKPDLVAPGEKIRAPYPKLGLKTDSGTSMAAPHVSGAAALILARYPEFIGNPLKIKQILCDSATDLKRRREFQGAGLVDVLRALQSI